jgi:hypothetical protein
MANRLYSSLLDVVSVISVLLRHSSARHSDEAQPD